MKIYGIKCSEVMVCAGAWAKVAEAAVETQEHGTVYVTVQEYEGQDYSVSKKSMYALICENGPEPADSDFLEEFGDLKKAKESAYWKVYDKLRKTLKMIGVVE